MNEAAQKMGTANPKEFIRDPYVLDFLDLGDYPKIHESDVEKGLIDHLQSFLLELGKGFCFVGRQKLMRYDEEDFYIDLVFYHSVLKCYVLIDLKLEKLTHGDVGQMDSYIRMFNDLYKQADDNPTIGIILCSQKNDAVVKYSVEQHVKSFAVMAELLAGYTHTCIISFVDIYNKVAQNFPELKPVSNEEQIAITKAFVEIGNRYDISIKTCVENSALSALGADCSGCSAAPVFEKAFGLENSALTFAPPKKKFARSECEVCVVSGDVGAYSNCLHLCKYCYANYGKDVVLLNHKMHDPESPLIIGNLKTNDVIHQAKQISWIVPRNDKQINLFDE